MNDTAARLWHPWLRINRVLRAMLHEHWSAEAGEGTEDVRKGWTVTTPPRFAQSPRTRVHPARQGNRVSAIQQEASFGGSRALGGGWITRIARGVGSPLRLMISQNR